MHSFFHTPFQKNNKLPSSKEIPIIGKRDVINRSTLKGKAHA